MGFRGHEGVEWGGGAFRRLEAPRRVCEEGSDEGKVKEREGVEEKRITCLCVCVLFHLFLRYVLF